MKGIEKLIIFKAWLAHTYLNSFGNLSLAEFAVQSNIQEVYVGSEVFNPKLDVIATEIDTQKSKNQSC